MCFTFFSTFLLSALFSLLLTLIFRFFLCLYSCFIFGSRQLYPRVHRRQVKSKESTLFLQMCLHIRRSTRLRSLVLGMNNLGPRIIDEEKRSIPRKRRTRGRKGARVGLSSFLFSCAIFFFLFIFMRSFIMHEAENEK